MTSTVRSMSRGLDREFRLEPGESAEESLRRIDRRCVELVRRHLFGDTVSRSLAGGSTAGATA